MKECTCLHCGRTVSDRTNGGVRKFCSRACRCAYYYRTVTKPKLEQEETPEDRICVHNKGVLCTEAACASCGWNPEVEALRKAAILEVVLC